MIQFLTSTSTVRLIEQIVIDAEDNLVLASASPRFSARLKKHIKAASDRGVSISLLVDDVLYDDVLYDKAHYDESDENAARLEDEVENLHIVRCSDLNGNCYWNETKMVITSMGLSEIPVNGTHMGVLLSSDEAAYKEAVDVLNVFREAVPGGSSSGELPAEPPQTKGRRRSPGRRSSPGEKRENRSPLLRVIRGGVRLHSARSADTDPENRVDAEPKPGDHTTCIVCNSELKVMRDAADEQSICRECADRKHYRHTSLYLAGD